MSNSFNPYTSPATLPGQKMKSNRAQPPLAGLGKRFLGALLDGFIPMVFLIPGYALIIFGAISNAESNSVPVMVMAGFGIIILGSLVILGIQIYLLAARSQTIGKLIVKTQIWDVETRKPADFVKTFLLRLIVNGLLGVIPLYGLIDICFIFREDRRCIHDLLAGTVVLDIGRR